MAFQTNNKKHNIIGAYFEITPLQLMLETSQWLHCHHSLAEFDLSCFVFRKLKLAFIAVIKQYVVYKKINL